MTSFQSFCLALSGRVGTGNIVGVASAIAIGGPGSVFWMWVIAIVGAATAFVESTLAQLYRFKSDGIWKGGPACYIEKGLGQRWLGVIFALLTVVGYGLLLSMVQANGASSAFENSFGFRPIYVGLAIVVLLALVIFGGLGRIAKFASVVTPIMALGYIILSVVVVCINISEVPHAFASIFKGAFGIGPAFAGMVGSAISMGVKRGLFSNEAGQGGGAIVSASTSIDHPAKQGLVQSFSVYIDTIVVCTATALMILCTGSHANPALDGNFVGTTQAAIDTVFMGWGNIFVTIALAFFTFTTIVAYDVYAESSISYLFEPYKGAGARTAEKISIILYRLLLFVTVAVGACTQAGVAWTCGDIGVGITTWINIIVLIILCPKAAASLKDFEASLRKK